jgi:hypothetical protein
MRGAHYLSILFMSFLSILLEGCGGKPAAQATPSQGPPIMKISVYVDGRVTADGQTVTMDSLRESLKKLAEQKGVVWYYREAGKGEPPPEAMDVIQAVIQERLPIRMSSRPDYSDSIGLDGRPSAP